MSIRQAGSALLLEDHCRVEDAEILLRLALETPNARLDLSGCRTLHAAVLQVILALDLPVGAAPQDPFLAAHVAPNLRRAVQL